ncbi:hypothetical protein [Promicromonospora panici]|uniref:hypothetical protein n=1 Tax=Promicromonospora panici TaxID=2219658 RepID=UPI00101D0A92|nr:hypothetical protein [Promicromonospora panici]
MTIQDLETALRLHNVPSGACSIGTDVDEPYSLVPESDRWMVYYSERGKLERSPDLCRWSRVVHSRHLVQIVVGSQIAMLIASRGGAANEAAGPPDAVGLFSLPTPVTGLRRRSRRWMGSGVEVTGLVDFGARLECE